MIIRDKSRKQLFAGGFFLGNTTNNIAEYEGLVRALRIARQLGGSRLKVFCDSELVVKQVNGLYRVKNAQLQQFFRQVLSCLDEFESVRLEHVFREDNADADLLVNQAIDAASDVGGLIRHDKSDSCEVSRQGKSGGSTTRPSTKAAVPASSAAPPSISERVVHLVELADKKLLLENLPYKEILTVGPAVRAELITIPAGQRFDYPAVSAGTTLNVVHGRGAVQIAGEEFAVQAGTWLQIRRPAAIDFTALKKQDLVVIVTQPG